MDEVRALWERGDPVLPFARAGDSLVGVLLEQRGSHLAGTVLRDGDFYAEDLTALLQCLFPDTPTPMPAPVVLAA